MNLKYQLNRTSHSLRCLLTGLALVLFALLARLAALSPAGASLAQLDAGAVWTLAAQCLTAQPVSADTASTEVSRPERPPKAQAAAAPEASDVPAAPEEPAAPEPSVPLSFAASEADAIELGGTCTYTPDKAAALLAPSPLSPVGEDPSVPSVLIVHTHTTEAYTPEPGWEYEPSGGYRTLDANYNVTRVGEEIAQVLRDCGIGVIHDVTVHDSEDFNGAYGRSYDTIAQELAANPSIQVVLDVHRDAVEDDQGQVVALSSQLNGQSCAKIMLVTGTDEGGLEHPDWQQNFTFALQLQALISRDYPALCRQLSLRSERFNQQFTPGSLLVEVGTSGNTLAEALLSARCFARELASYLKSLG